MPTGTHKRIGFNVAIDPAISLRANKRFGQDPNALPYNPWFLDLGNNARANSEYLQEVQKMRLMNQLAMEADKASQERRAAAAVDLMKKQAELQEIAKTREQVMEGESIRESASAQRVGLPLHNISPESLGRLVNRYATPFEMFRAQERMALMPEHERALQQLAIDQANSERIALPKAMQNREALDAAKVEEAQNIAAHSRIVQVPGTGGYFETERGGSKPIAWGNMGGMKPIRKQGFQETFMTTPDGKKISTGMKPYTEETLSEASFQYNGMPLKGTIDMETGKLKSGGNTVGSPSFYPQSHAEQTGDTPFYMQGRGVADGNSVAQPPPASTPTPTTTTTAPKNETGALPTGAAQAPRATGGIAGMKEVLSTITPPSQTPWLANDMTFFEWLKRGTPSAPPAIKPQVPNQAPPILPPSATSLQGPSAERNVPGIPSFLQPRKEPDYGPPFPLPPQPAVQMPQKPYGKRNTNIPLSEATVQDYMDMLRSNPVDNVLDNYTNYMQYLQNSYGGGEPQQQQAPPPIPQLPSSGLGTSAFQNLTQSQLQNKPLSEMIPVEDQLRFMRPKMLEEFLNSPYEDPRVRPMY